MKKIVALVALALALTACGSSGGRPTTDELAKAMKDNLSELGMPAAAEGSTDKMFDCVAEGLHDSDLSDDQLRAIADGKSSISDEGEATTVITKVTTDCVKDSMPDMEMPESPTPTE